MSSVSPSGGPGPPLPKPRPTLVRLEDCTSPARRNVVRGLFAGCKKINEIFSKLPALRGKTEPARPYVIGNINAPKIVLAAFNYPPLNNGVQDDGTESSIFLFFIALWVVRLGLDLEEYCVILVDLCPAMPKDIGGRKTNTLPMVKQVLNGMTRKSMRKHSRNCFPQLRPLHSFLGIQL